MFEKKDLPPIIAVAVTLLASALIAIMILMNPKAPKTQSDQNRQKADQDISTEVTTQTSEAPVPDLIDYSIYNQEAMANNGIEKLDLTNYSSIDQVIESVITEFGVYPDSVSVAYYNFTNQDQYFLNPDIYRVAASTCKVPYASIVYDLLNNQYTSMDTYLANHPDFYAEGDGNIANGIYQDAYPLSQVLYEMLVNSDNTATNILYAYYQNYFGDVETDMANFVGMTDMPGEFYYDNLLSANFLLNNLIKLVNHPDLYQGLIDTMMEPKQAQLFTTYVSQGMANKYGRIDVEINDCGVYFEDGQAQYALVVMTDNVMSDAFLEVLNLRVNEWIHYQKTEAYKEAHSIDGPQESENQTSDKQFE